MSDLDRIKRERRRRKLRKAGLTAPIEALFARPPVLPGEREADFLDMHDRVRTAMAPQDMIEEAAARAMTELIWEIQRYQRIKTAFLRRHFADEEKILIRQRSLAVWDLIERRGKKQKLINQARRELGIGDDEVLAQVIVDNRKNLEPIDRAIENLRSRMASEFYHFNNRRRAEAEWEIEKRRRALSQLAQEDGGQRLLENHVEQVPAA